MFWARTEEGFCIKTGLQSSDSSVPLYESRVSLLQALSVGRKNIYMEASEMHAEVCILQITALCNHAVLINTNT